MSAKLSPENTEFLQEWARNVKPYPVSESSLLDLCVRIVRKLVREQTIDLEPVPLQAFLSNESNAGKGGKR